MNVITYRTDMLAAMFTLLGLTLWLKPPRIARFGERTQFFWVPLIYFLGVGSKSGVYTAGSDCSLRGPHQSHANQVIGPDNGSLKA